jgi:hypothetical protein
VTVPFRDHWFWLDDCNLKTKRAFALLVIFSTLGHGGPHESVRLITIPAH